jgi:hypothetical protein
MKSQLLILASAALLLGTACSSEPKATPETTPAPMAAPEATPTPVPAKPEVAACEGKMAKAACNFAGEKGEMKGNCGPVAAPGTGLECKAGKKPSKKK